MSETSNLQNTLTGRDASRMRRNQMLGGKTGLPPVRERVSTGRSNGKKPSAFVDALPSGTVSPVASEVKLNFATTEENQQILTGREASRARRKVLIQGKQGTLKSNTSETVVSTTKSVSSDDSTFPSVASEGRLAALALRKLRGNRGRNKSVAESRPCGRVRPNVEPVQYPPKVAESKSYAGQNVTGVRIGQKDNVTGNEPGAALQVTGDQYIGTESGYNPREGDIKVGASKTPAGLVVTGSQVRSKISITGDESNPALRITGESDQELNDDLIERREQGGYAQMQFQRQNNPHGHTVFGTNLGRSIKSVGSRNRDTEYSSKEESMGGHEITGTAVGRSELTTGDESGSCRDVTGDQYLMPAVKQKLCEPNNQSVAKVGVSHTLHGARTTGTQTGQRIRHHGNISGTVNDGLCQDISGTESFGAEQYAAHCGEAPMPTGGRRSVEAATWEGQYVTGVDVEHNSRVTGDEQGLCDVITGTPYAGRNQYQSSCSAEDEDKAEQRISSTLASANYISGDVLSSADHVTGTQRGGERSITGTPYFKADPEGDGKMDTMERVRKINNSFSVHSPQREYQERVGTDAINAPTAESRITGTFSAGEGKITGNQEFHFNPRSDVEAIAGKLRVTGEGRVDGKTITGSAWGSQENVTGTEGHIAAERNPSQRKGNSHAWAGASRFKEKGTHPEPTHHVTGMVGWSPKASAPITVSGGAQG